MPIRVIYEYDKRLYWGKNPQNRLEITQDGNEKILWLNNQFMFSNRDEKVYHESLGILPMIFASRISNVAILGGGDGVLLREILRFPVEQIYLCEIDEEIIGLAKQNPFLIKTNRGSFFDSRITVVIKDAKEFVKNPPVKLDVIIADFPSPDTEELNQLFTMDFYRDVKSGLVPCGVFMTHIGTTHSKRLEVENLLNQLFTNVLPFVVPAETFEGKDDWYDFLIASNSPLNSRREIPTKAKWLTNDNIDKMIKAGKEKQFSEG